MSRKHVKKIFLMTAALILCLCIQGCGKESAEEDNPKMVYVPEFTEVPSDYEWISHIFAEEDRVIFCGTVNSEEKGRNETVIKQMDVATLTQSDVTLDLGDDINLQSIVPMSKGYMILVEKCVEAGHDYSFEYSIQKYDSEFHKLEDIPITKFLEKAANSYGRVLNMQLALDKAGNIYIYEDGMVWVFDSVGTWLFDIELEDRFMISELKATEEGQVFLVYEGYNDTGYVNNVKFIDLEKQALSDALENVPGAEAGIKIFPAREDKLYVSTPSTLYQYDIATQQAEELLAWGNCDLVGNDIDECMVLEDGTIITIGQVINNAEKRTRMSIEITKLRPVLADSVTPKRELILAILSADSEVRQWVVDFNRSNSEYRINIHAYVNDDFSNYEEALTQFNIDVSLGNKADIIIFPNGTDISLYASKGALADLNELMETDAEIQKEDFIPNILDTLSMNGKLYAIGDQFDVRSLVGKVSNVGTDSSWTIADVKALVEANPDALLINLLTQEYGLRFFLECSMDSFYDRQKGEYNFQTREFHELLELVAAFPTEFEAADKEVLLHSMSIYSYYWLQAYEELYGESVNMIGYPVAGGSGNIAEFNMLMAIGAQSQNKEGAWQFIRQFITLEAQRQARWGLPISKQVFEEWITEKMVPIEEASKATMVYDNVEIVIDELTEERAEIIRDTVYGVTARYIQNEHLYNIIAEEAGAFFAGQKTVDEVIEIIQNRAQVYMQENQ